MIDEELIYLKRGASERYCKVLNCARHTKLQNAIQHLLKVDQGTTTTTKAKQEQVRYVEWPKNLQRKVRFSEHPQVQWFYENRNTAAGKKFQNTDFGPRWHTNNIRAQKYLQRGGHRYP